MSLCLQHVSVGWFGKGKVSMLRNTVGVTKKAKLMNFD